MVEDDHVKLGLRALMRGKDAGWFPVLRNSGATHTPVVYLIVQASYEVLLVTKSMAASERIPRGRLILLPSDRAYQAIMYPKIRECIKLFRKKVFDAREGSDLSRVVYERYAELENRETASGHVVI